MLGAICLVEFYVDFWAVFTQISMLAPFLIEKVELIQSLAVSLLQINLECYSDFRKDIKLGLGCQ